MRRLLPELFVISLLATAGALVFVNDPGSQAPSKPPAAEQAAAGPRTGPKPDPDDPHTWQTSDQVPGEIAPPLVPGRRVVRARTKRFTYEPAPGVSITGWDARTQRGP